MSEFRSRKTALAAAVAGFGLVPVLAGSAVPLGPEILVNSETTARAQNSPAVAMSAQGAFVVTWQHDFSGSNDDQDILARLYSASGQPGALILVAGLSAIEILPRAAMDALGGFVVIWERDGDVYGRRFNASGAALALEFRVNSYTAGVQGAPAIASAAGGDFVVTWSGNGQDDASGVFAQRYSANGVPLGSEFRVNTVLTLNQRNPAIGVQADGDFVIAWESEGQDGGGFGVYGQRYSAAGTARGNEFKVNASTTGDQISAALALDADGDFVVAWQDDAGVDSVLVQRFAASGVVLGGPFRVGSGTLAQTRPGVAVDADGDFIISWSGDGFEAESAESAKYEAYVQRYAANGSPRGAEVLVNVRDTNLLQSPVVATDADGDFVVAWDTFYFVPGQTGDLFDVRAQRYRGDETVDLDVSLDASHVIVPTEGDVSYTARISNLRAPDFSTGVEAIDAAIGSALGSYASITLPPSLVLVQAPSSPAATCRARGDGYRCDLDQPLAAGAAVDIAYVRRAPASSGAMVSTAAVATQSLEEDLTNNRDRARTRVDCVPATLTFIDDPFTVSEGASEAIVSVVRSAGSCGGSTTVQVDTASGSATAGLDFVDTSSALFWSAGVSSAQSFTIPLLGDTLDEIDERVVIRLSSPVNARIEGLATARLVITDNDASPRVNFTTRAQTVAESAGLVTVSVALSEISGRNVVVPFSLGGSATTDVDFFAGNTALTIPAGSLSASKNIEIVDDDSDEANETLVLSLGTPTGAVAGSISSHTLTVTDNDEPPPGLTVSFTTASTSGPEGAARGAVVSLSAAATSAVTVPFTVSGTASVGDFTLNRSSPLNFAAGVTSISIQIGAPEDAEVEPNETVILTLGTPIGATPGALTQHTRTILNND